MKRLTFRAFHRPSKDEGKPGFGNKEDALRKRREQVRKAQRTYRERREEYVKSLEFEVMQLRANEGNLLRETERLYSELYTLKTFLVERGMELPANFEGPESNKAVVFIARGSQKGHQICIRDPNSNLTAPRDESHILGGRDTLSGAQVFASGSESSGSALASPTKINLGPEQTSVAGSISNALELRPPKQINQSANLNLTTLGMEFVLTLESPCLEHMRGDPHTATSHALTASAPLLFLSPEFNNREQITSAWEAPTDLLERLLTLSSDLKLDDEITPIQAWNFIRQHPEFDGIEMYRIKALTEKLLKQVKCHGFGAVIDQGAFENLVFEAFVVGRVFERPYG